MRRACVAIIGISNDLRYRSGRCAKSGPAFSTVASRPPPGAPHATLRVTAGEAWLTVDGIRDDYRLAAGESFALPRGWRVWIARDAAARGSKWRGLPSSACNRAFARSRCTSARGGRRAGAAVTPRGRRRRNARAAGSACRPRAARAHGRSSPRHAPRRTA
ncbi:DUF2917 domain-containing protein [Burkholderia mayonis]|uniref:DUF2917 domain-containing protein n=1 Tax=Burkholderia mayonis TaxID=1385591 RepID=UPI001CF7953E